MPKSRWKYFFGRCCFFLLCSLLFSPPLSAMSPWELSPGESLRTGVYLGRQGAGIILQAGPEAPAFFTLAPDFLAVLGGVASGRVVSVADLPVGIEVDLYLTASAQVRALRNHIPAISLPGAAPLPDWSEDVLPSPDGRYYLQYTYENGFVLYDDVAAVKTFLGGSGPVAAWTADGNKLAYWDGDAIVIYTPLTGSSLRLPLPALPPGLVRVLQKLSWSPQGESFFFTSLCDYPDLGSSVFQLTVWRADGRPVTEKTIEMLENAVWVDEDRIIYSQAEGPLLTAGTLRCWDTKTGIDAELLPASTGGYHDLACHAEKGILAYTSKGGKYESIMLLALDVSPPAQPQPFPAMHELVRSPYPLHHLQWSNDSLYYWDEYSNTVNEVKADRTVTQRVSGYLPPVGVSQNRFYYYAAPPGDGLQPVFRSP